MEERADTETRRRGDAGNTYSPTHLLTNHPEHLNARMPEGLDSPILLHSSTPPLLFCLSGCRKGAISWMVRIHRYTDAVETAEKLRDTLVRIPSLLSCRMI